jgi:pimeloyl-ACP methyl ester carboxylesterase
MILVHGGGLSSWSWKPVMVQVQRRLGPLCFVLPIIDGHGADAETPFVSIEDSASNLVSYVREECAGHVAVVAGLSIGAQIVVEALSQDPDIADAALIESACVVSLSGTGAMATVSGAVAGLAQHEWFARAQAKSLALPDDEFDLYFEDSRRMRPATLSAVVRANGSYSLKPGFSQATAPMFVCVGSKEPRPMRESAELIAAAVPHAELRVLEGMGHGELSLRHPDLYAGMLAELLGEAGISPVASQDGDAPIPG